MNLIAHPSQLVTNLMSPRMSAVFIAYGGMPIINPRRACAARVTVVLCVCVSVIKSHLTNGVSVRPENAVTYSAGNKGQKFVGFSLKPLHCRDSALPALYGYLSPAVFRYAEKRACAITTCACDEWTRPR